MTTYNYTSKRGDYKLLPFAVVDSEAAAVDLTNATVTAAYRSQLTGQIVKQFAEDDGYLTIDNAAAGYLTLAFRHDMAAGLYDYDVQFDFADASIDRQTLIEGVCTLTQDVTP